MADFSSRISEIRADLDTLLTTLNRMDQELKTASSDFESLAANAKEISSLSTAIQKLSKFLGQEKSPLLDSLKSRVAEINTELQGLNLSQLQNANTALEANAKALAAISRAQANINRNQVNALSALGAVRAELDGLERASSTTGTAFEQSIQRIVQSLSQLNGLTNVATPIDALNQLNPEKYSQAATALQKIHDVVAALKNANVTIDVSAAGEADKLVHKPIQPMVKPTLTETEVPVQRASKPVQTAPTVVKYAQENGIDLTTLTGTGARNRITRDDVLKAIQSNAAPVTLPASAAPDQVIANARVSLERNKAGLVKLDAAIADARAKAEEVLKTTFKDYGIKTTGQQETAREFLIPNPNARLDQRRTAERNFRDSFKEAGLIEADFKSNLAGTKPRETGLPEKNGLNTIQIADEKAIKRLYDLREQLAKEIEKISKVLDNPQFSLMSDALAAGQAAIKGITNNRTGPASTPTYLLNKLAGREDVFTGGTGVVDENLIGYDSRTKTYSTKGNGVKGANDAEFEVNRAAITRAVKESVNGIAVIGSTGANLGGASLLGGDKVTAGVDHVAVAFLDAVTGEIRIREKNFSTKISDGNKSGSALLGSEQAAERSLDDFAAKVDRVTVTALNVPPEQAEKFKEGFFAETDQNSSSYSFAKALTEVSDAGNTCATAFTTVAKEAGILDIQGKFEKTPLIGAAVSAKANIVTPHDVIKAVQDYNAGDTLIERQRGSSTNSINTFEILRARLTTIFESIGERIKTALSDIKSRTKDISIGDIFEYVKSLVKPQDTARAVQEAQPQLSIGAGGLRQRAADFSRDYYRPVQTGLTFFGAGLNSVQEITKGLQNGGPGGLLDIAGGAIKGAHTIANANAYFGLNLLPKGIGELFNQRRSDTILDIFEAVVKGKTGYGRQSVDKNFERLKEQEAPLEARKNELKEAIKSGNLVGDDLTKAHNELAAVSEELKQLRQAINAYRRVLAEEAKNAAEKPAGGPSKGKKLDEEAQKAAAEGLLNSVPPPSADVRAAAGAPPRSHEIDQELQKKQTLLDQQAQEALARFSAGTGFETALSGGIKVVNPAEMGATLRSLYSKESLRGIDTNKVSGANLPGNQLVVSTIGEAHADTAIHEGVHSVINQAGLKHGDYFSERSKNLQATIPDSFNQEFFDKTEALQNKISDHHSKNILDAYYGDLVAQEYYNKPTEQNAYVGQALLTDNKELQQVLQHIYGKDLYNSIVEDLKTSIPNTFGDEALKILIPRFKEFAEKFNKIVAESANPQLLFTEHGSWIPAVDTTDSGVNDLARKSLKQFAQGTDYESRADGLYIAHPKQFDEIYKEEHATEKTVNAQGFFSPPNTNVVKSTIDDPARVAVHELTHDLANQAGKEALTYRNKYLSQSTEDLKYTGLRFGAGGYTADQHATASELINSFDSTKAKNVIAGYYTKAQYRDYYNKPSEQYAHVGEALVTDNKELQQALEHIYGKDLYNSIIKDLETAFPNTFGAEALAILKVKFKTFAEQFNELVAENANPQLSVGGAINGAVDVAENVKQTVKRARDAKGRFVSQATLAAQEAAGVVAPVVANVAGNIADSAHAVIDSDSAKQVENLVQNTLPQSVKDRTEQRVDYATESAKIVGGIAKDVDFSQIFNELKVAFRENFGNNLQEVSTKLIQLSADIPEYGNLLQKAVSPNSANLTRITQAATELYVPQGTPQRRLYESFNVQGGEKLTQALIQAIQEPTKESFSKLFQSAKNVDIQKVIEQYVGKIFTDGGLDLKGGLIATQLFKDRTPQGLIGTFASQFKPNDVTFRDELNAKVRDATGKNIQAGSYSQQAVFDPNTGVQKFSVSAKTADGAMVSLNAHIDEFGHKHIEAPEGITKLREAATEFLRAIPRQLADQFTYTIVDSFQQMFRQLISVQDELSEVANLLGVVGDKAIKAKSQFLFNSVTTAVKTGQGFDEAIQTNLKNFKILGSVKDTDKRSVLANQISEVQLGAQTAFGISLEQSLESIPAILATIKDGLDDIPDPADKVTEALRQLKGVTDDIVVAQRSTGAQADDLIVTYSRLAESAKQYGLNSKQLLAFVATSSVAIGKGPDENSNIARAFLEGTYSEANQAQFAKSGISTKTLNARTNQIENRSFEDILKDLYKLSKDDSKSVEYNQLLQSIAGPKLKPDIAKAVAGFGSGYATVLTAEQGAQSGTFEKLVSQKSENFQGSANKLEATGTQLFGSLLVGTGALDDMTKILDRLSEAAVRLTGFLNNNQDAIRGIVERIKPFITFFTAGQLSRGLNIFEPIAKGINQYSLAVEATKAKIIDFGAVGEGAPTGITRTIKLGIAVLKEMQEVATRTGETIVNEFDKAAGTIDRLNNASKGAQAQVATNLTKASGEFNKLAGNPQLAVSAGGFVSDKQTPIKQRLALAALDKEKRAEEIKAIEQQLIGAAAAEKEKLGNLANTAAKITSEQAIAIAYNVQSDTPLSDRIRNRISRSSSSVTQGLETTTDTLQSIVDPPQSRLQKVKQSLEKPGAIAGALVAPVAFDAIAGGFGKDNLTNIGLGIAGGIAGGFVGGPFGATIGYSIAKSISEYIDLPGAIGTSEKESNTFSTALGDLIYGKKDIPADQDPTSAETKLRVNGQIQKLLDSSGFDDIRNRYRTFAENNKDSNGVVAVSSSNDVKQYLEFQKQNGRGPGFFDNYKINNGVTEQTIGLFGKNKELLDLFTNAGVSSVGEFLRLLDQAARGLGPLADGFAKLDVVQQQKIKTDALQADADTKQALYESGQQAIDRTSGELQNVTEQNTQRYATPLGADTYSSFGSKYKDLESGYNATLDKIKAGTLSGQPAQDALARYDKAFAAMEQLPATLQQLVPFAQAQGLSTTGLEQKLYNTGAEGQQKLVQRFQPAIQADSFIREYEQKQRNVTALRDTAGFKSGTDDAVIKQVAALEKALGIDKARYSISLALIGALKGQTNILLEQADAIEKQSKTRQLISAGTPAQFTPANIFDTKGLNSNQLNAAIDFAIKKQARLEALNPNYRKEFAKDQFLLQSGNNFKGVTGVNQGFVQEYLQQQQQNQAPLEDLSKFSDQEISKILDQARALQGQAEKLDPSRAGKYENDRILILKKNNDLLAQTGLGQEFLKLAIQENTKASDQLRGHFNLPSSYKAPTIFDYYANGGTEKGDKNFPTAAGQGLVPLSFAQQLAQQIVAGNAGNKGADLSSIAGTDQAGARPLFYPNPGTGAVYSDIVPEVLPDSIKQDKNISAAVQRFYDFKQKQIEDFDNATKVDKTDNHYSSDSAPRLTPEPYAGDLGANKKLNPKTRNTTDIADDYTKTAASTFGTTIKGMQDALNLLKDPLKASAEAGKTFSGSLAPIPTAMSSLNTGANTFAQTVSTFAAKVGNFDLADAIKRSNIQIQVTVNGQTTTADSVVITNSAPTGTSTLSAGPANRSTTRTGNRQ